MTRAWSALVGLVIAAPFYWLLVDTLYEPDLIAGGVAVVIAAAAYVAAHVESIESPEIRARWLLRGLRELAKVPMGVLIVCREVVAQTVAPRRRRGVLEADPFETGSGTPHDLGRRALAEAVRSFAPNMVVIGADPDTATLVVHRLGPER